MEETNVVQGFTEKQSKMMNEIVDVFERNEANVFEMFRVLAIMKKVAEEQTKTAFAELSDQLEELMAALEGVNVALEKVDEEEG